MIRLLQDRAIEVCSQSASEPALNKKTDADRHLDKDAEFPHPDDLDLGEFMSVLSAILGPDATIVAMPDPRPVTRDFQPGAHDRESARLREFLVSRGYKRR